MRQLAGILQRQAGSFLPTRNPTYFSRTPGHLLVMNSWRVRTVFCHTLPTGNFAPFHPVSWLDHWGPTGLISDPRPITKVCPSPVIAQSHVRTKSGPRGNASRSSEAMIEASMHRVSYQGYIPSKGSPLVIIAMLQSNIGSSRSARSTIGRSLIFGGFLRERQHQRSKARGSESDSMNRFLFGKTETQIVF